MSDRDTIFATSSGAPPAAIAIVRISGPVAFAIAGSLIGRLPPARQAGLRAVRDPYSRALLDRALVLVFPAPRTATGEDVVELHVHGGRAVVAAVELAISSQPRARRAEPGEFTRRALENGVIDLTEAEGLGDLLAAETETQRHAALHIAEGGLRAIIDRWTRRLVAIAARIEAQLDFSDEDDVAEEAVRSVLDDIAAVKAEIDDVLRQPPVERLHDGVRVVIAGPPNSGKSTLLNALAGRDMAIVSPISGTTRDRIEASVIRNGIAYVLTDTAGLTETPGDDVERIGVARAEAAVLAADIVLWLGDVQPSDSRHLGVHARADLPERRVAPPWADLRISAATDLGMDALWASIAKRAAALLPRIDTVTTNQRQRSFLLQCVERLGTACHESDLLVIAEELRSALRKLDAIVGRSGTEDILDALFAKFCIGK